MRSFGSPGRFGLLVWGIFLLALALRAFHVATVLHSPLGDTLVLDARYYHEEALRLVGSLPSREGGVTFMNVGYPYALAAVYAVFGASVPAALAVQAILGAASSALLALAARRLTGSATTGVLAGILYALYQGAVFYDGSILTPSLVNACLAGGLYLLSIPPSRGRLPCAAGAGLLVGLAVLLRANVALIVPAWIVAAWSGAETRRFKLAFATGLAAAALPGATVLANGLAHGQWAPVSANAGMNFWVGNHAGASGVYSIAPFVGDQDPEGELRGFLDEARRRSSNPAMTLTQSDRYWFHAGWADVKSEPGTWLARVLRKLALFWSREEVRTNVGLRFVEGFSPALRWTPVGFGLLSIFGAGGLFLLSVRGEARCAWLLLGLLFAPLATCAAFFVSGEYRHPASLALCVGAAAILDAVWSKRGGIGWALVVAAGIAPLAFWPRPDIRAAADPAIDTWNVVRKLTGPAPGTTEPAAEALSRAVALADRPPAIGSGDLFVLDARLRANARAAVALGDPARVRAAIDAARAILGRDVRPGMAGYFEGFAVHLRASVRDHVAEIATAESARRDAALARELALLGANRWREIDAFFEKGDLAGAGAFVRDALARAPHEPLLQAAMGALFLADGRDADGVHWLERSCDGWPEIPECAYSLASYWLSHGDVPRAEAAAREALRREPDFSPARELLERIGVRDPVPRSSSPR